jgi:hypothetical protein
VTSPLGAEKSVNFLYSVGLIPVQRQNVCFRIALPDDNNAAEQKEQKASLIIDD